MSERNGELGNRLYYARAYQRELQNAGEKGDAVPGSTEGSEGRSTSGEEAPLAER